MTKRKTLKIYSLSGKRKKRILTSHLINSEMPSLL
jgi:hypothetical protein